MVYFCWFKAAKDGKIDDIKRLLKRGFKVNKAMDIKGGSDGGETALLGAAIDGHVEIVTLLLENNADVNKSTTNLGVTSLYVASQEGKMEVVRCLVEEGKAEVDKADERGVTLLFVASTNDHLAVRVAGGIFSQLKTYRRLLGRGSKIDCLPALFIHEHVCFTR